MFANDIRMFLKPLTSITTEGFFVVVFYPQNGHIVQKHFSKFDTEVHGPSFFLDVP